MCGICGVVALEHPRKPRPSARCSPGSATAGPDGEGFVDGPGSRSATRASRSSTSPKAAASRSRATTARYSSSTTARSSTTCELRRGARGARPPVPHARPTPRSCCRVRAMGRALRRALQRHVGVRALGCASAPALLLPRPLRDQAVRLPVGRATGSPSRASLGRCSRDPSFRRATRTCGDPRLPRAGIHRPSRRDVLRRRQPASAGALACRSTRRPAPRALVEARAGDPPADSGRSVPRAVRRLDSAAAPQRRAARDGTLGRARLVCRRGDDRPPAADRERSRRGRSASGRRTFTAYFDDPGLDERPYADAVGAQILSRAAPADVHGQRLLDVLPEVVAAQGEPFGSTSIVAQWFVMRAARAARD